MKRKEEKPKSGLLFGLTFIAPVAYSTSLHEMDNLQRLIFLGIALLIFLTIIYKYKEVTQIALNKLLLILIILFPLSFLTAFANGSSYSLPLLFTNLLIPLCIAILSVFMFLILGEEKFFKTVSLSVIIISTLFGMIGLLEVFQIKTIPLPTIIPPGSTLGHRSFAVEYLVPAIPFVLILKDYVKKNHYPFLFAAAFSNISFVLFTRSRSAMVVIVLIALIYFIHLIVKTKSGSKIKSLIPAASVLAAAFAFSFLPAEGAQRTDFKDSAESLFDVEFRSNKLRMTYWDASLLMISGNPFDGVGLFKWSGYYPKYNPDEFNDKTVLFMQSTHAHNDFLELFAENGIFSPLLYLLIILLINRIIFLKSKTNPKYFLILLSVLSTVIFSLVAFPLFKFASYFFLSVCAGIALLGDKENKKKNLLIDARQLKAIFILLLLIGTFTSYIKLQSELNYIKAIYFMQTKSIIMMNEKLNNVSSILYPYNPPKQPVDYYRGLVSSYMKNYPEALDHNLHAEELAPFSPVILSNVATAYHSIGKTKEAISRFERLKELFPDYSDPQIKLLYLYVAEKQKEKGKKLLAELLERFPDNPSLIEIKEKAYLE